MIYFLGYMFIEILVSYEFTKLFTPFGMFLEIILSAVLGIIILQNLNLSIVENIIKVSKREISIEEFKTIGLFKFVGAILLIVPGVFTDMLGLLMQFEEFGAFIGRKFSKKKEFSNKYDDNIIDVEIIEDKK